MSLPAHLRSLVAAASLRAARDRAAAVARAEQAQRTAAQVELAAQSARFDAYLTIHEASLSLPVSGYVLSWDDCPLGVWGPGGAGPLARWMTEQFASDGLFPAALVAEPQTTPVHMVWVWPSYAAALAAVRALDPHAAEQLASRAA